MKYEIKAKVDVEFSKIYLASAINEGGGDGGRILWQISREVWNTREKVLRKALIKLGWTPPKKKRKQ
jgi:hypothetical protein